MAAISGRSPQVIVEYTARGKRVEKLFTKAHEARQFYAAKLKAGADPKVKKAP